MALKDKLHNVKMIQGESVTSYLTRVAHVKVELAAVGETISHSELVRIALKGFTKRWEFFCQMYCWQRETSGLVQDLG